MKCVVCEALGTEDNPIRSNLMCVECCEMRP